MSERLGPEGWESAGEMQVLPESWWAPLIRWFPPSSHLQEFGCCGGSTAIHLAKSSMRYTFTLVDFNSEALRRAHARFREMRTAQAMFFEQDVLEDFPPNFPTGDISYSLGLLEHFSDDEIVRILKNQSRFCRTVMAAVPNANCTSYTSWKKREEDAGTWQYGYEDPKTLNQMKAFFDAAGIDVIAHTTMGDNFIDDVTDERYLLAVLGNVR